MTITVGTNSYISISDATTYFNESLAYAGVWQSLDPGTQEQALVTATRMLDRQTWQGLPTANPQSLQWPRTGVTDKYNQPVDPSSVPQNIIYAECELAMAIYSDPTVQTNKDNSSNIKSVKGGPAEVQFFRPINAGRFPTIVQELISQFLSGGTPAGMVSGNCGESKFDPRISSNDYNTTRGYS